MGGGAGGPERLASFFEDDRDRDAENLRCGIGTVRITRNRFDATPDYEAARLQEIMHPPGPGGRSS